jgi:ketosteroid isomerase-like protein
MAPGEVVDAFNNAINRRDLDGLAALMSDDHQFIDAENASLNGKSACLQAWQGFFEQFPDYRNTFTSMSAADGLVSILGYSKCSTPELEGPALWQAVVVEERVTLWRVFHDTPQTRAALGLA